MGIVDTIRNIITPKIPKIGSGPSIADTIKAVKSPSGTASGFTPVKDSSGRVIYNSPFRGGDSGGGSRGGGGLGGSGRSGPSGPSAAEIAAENKRIADQKLIDDMRKAGEARLAKQRTQTALRDIKGKRAAADIATSRQDILSSGGRVTTKTSRDVKTKDRLEITETRGRGGRKVVEVKNLETGEITTTEFGPGKAGGGVALKGGVVEAPIEEVTPEVIVGPLDPPKDTGDKKGFVETTTTSLISPFLIFKEIPEVIRKITPDLTPTIPTNFLTSPFIIPGQEAGRVTNILDTGVQTLASEIPSGFQGVLTSTQLGKDVVGKEVQKFSVFDTGIQAVSKAVAEQVPIGFQSVLRSTQLGKDVVKAEAQRTFNILDTGVQAVSRGISQQGFQGFLTSTQLGKDVITEEAKKFSVFDTGVQTVSGEIAKADLLPPIPTNFLTSPFIIPGQEVRRVGGLFDTGVQSVVGQVPRGFQGVLTSTQLGKDVVGKEVQKFSVFDTGIQAVSKAVAEQVPIGFQSVLRSTQLGKDVVKAEAQRTFNILDTGVQSVVGQVSRPDLTPTIPGTQFLTSPFIIPGQRIREAGGLVSERAETFLLGDVIVPKTLPTVSIVQADGSLFPVTKEVEFTTTREIKESLAGGSFGLAGQVISPLVPETPLEAGLLVGGFLALKAAPPIVRIGLDVAFTPGETRKVFDTTADTATRVRSGIFAGLGFGGLAFEGIPFVRGGLRRLSGSGLSIVDEAVDTSRLFPKGQASVIKDIPVSDLGKVDDLGGVSDLGKLDDTFDIKLIEEGKGFDFTTAEQKAFIGEDATITTSARNLLSAGDDVIVQPGAGDLGLFFTPTLDVTAGEARVSRLGLIDLMKPSGFDAPIGFQAQKPEIVFLRDVPITRTGEPGSARGIGFPSSELEVTLLPGTEITGGKVGTAVIKGQEVGVFEAFIKPGSVDDVSDVVRGVKVDIEGLDLSSVRPDVVVNPLSLIVGTAGTTRLFDTSTTPTTSTTTTTPPTTSTTTTTTPTSPPSRLTQPTSFLSPPVSPPPSTPPSTPTRPTSFLSPPVSPPSVPPSRPSGPPSRPTTTTTPPTTTGTPRRSQTPSLDILREMGWFAEVKVKGKFQKIQPKKPLRKREAEKLAKLVTDSTIHATARITPTSKTPALDLIRGINRDRKFRDYKIRGGQKVPMENTWIEHRRFRLDDPREVRTLQEFKRSSQFKDAFGVGGSSGGMFGSGSSSNNLFGSISPTQSRKRKSLKRDSFRFF